MDRNIDQVAGTAFTGGVGALGMKDKIDATITQDIYYALRRKL